MSSTANVVAVHGIGQQQSGRNQLLPLWTQALRDGIERAAGLGGPAIELDLGFYADLYLQAGTVKGPAETAADESDFFAELEAELVDEEPPAETVKGELPRPLGRLAGWLDHKFGVGAHLLFFGDLVQVRRYQRDGDLAAEVRARVHGALGPQTRIMIGHSLGSVVAYEYLCLTPDHHIETLITLGSPLGLRSIQDRLRTGGASPPVKRWLNVLDLSDPVACGGGLAPTWAAAVDAIVDNERDAHAATRYLGKRETGQAVVDTLRP